MTADLSNGYEAVAEDWIAQRGNPERRDGAIGAAEVAQWARALPCGSRVVDVGCGPGLPLTVLLVEAGLQAHGVDASSTLVAAFEENLPGVPVACASALEFDFFGKTFDAVLAVGLIFLLPRQEQGRLLQRFAEVLVPGGRLLFTAPARACEWTDVMTGLKSVSLGAEEYRRLLESAGFAVRGEFEDSGGNHYFDTQKFRQRT